MNAKQIIVAPGMPWDGQCSEVRVRGTSSWMELYYPSTPVEATLSRNWPLILLPTDGIEIGHIGEVDGKVLPPRAWGNNNPMWVESESLWPDSLWPHMDRAEKLSFDAHYIATPDALFLVAVPGDLTLSMALRTMFEAVAGPEPAVKGGAFLSANHTRMYWWLGDFGDEWHHELRADGYTFRISNGVLRDDSASGALSLLFDHYARARRHAGATI